MQCVIGAAGGGNAHNRTALTRTLSEIHFAQLTICSDALTSALGANLGQTVACVALGTGSVGLRIDANAEQHLVGGWGFTVGDEGSGARLGVMMIQALIEHIDTHTPLPSLLQHLSEQVGCSRDTLATWIARASVADYAALSPLIWPFRNTCHQAKKILATHARAIELLIDKTQAGQALPVVLLGGLAELSKPLLAPQYQAHLISAKGTALDGAFLLATHTCINGNK